MLPREKGGGSKHHNHLSAPTINSNGPSPFFLASAPAPRFTQVLLSAEEWASRAQGAEAMLDMLTAEIIQLRSQLQEIRQ